jgi:hypothetical protein
MSRIHISALALLILTTLFSAQVSAGFFSGWEFGLDFGTIAVQSPAYAAPTATFVDSWGDTYSIIARQEAVNNTIGFGADLRSPRISALSSDTFGTRFRVNGFGPFNKPSGNDSYSSLAVSCVGPMVEFKLGEARIEAGAYWAIGTADLVVAEMPAAWYGDPGYGTGSDWITPGTPIKAHSESKGTALSVGARFPLRGSDKWTVKVQATTVNGVRFSKYSYETEAEFGTTVRFNLPQLRPIDMSGTTLTAGMIYQF